MIQHDVPDTVRPMPLGKYLQRAWPMLPGHVLRDLLKRRDVKRGGQRLGAQDLVRPGDVLTIYLPDRYMPEPAQLVFDDGRLLAAVKPQGLPADADRDGIGADTLLARLRAVHPGAALCHRLDAATGGLVLAAADPAVCDQAVETFRRHALDKRYIAWAKGGFDRPEGTLKGWLTKDARSATVRVSAAERPGARPIETRYRVLSDLRGLARVELEPVTGRTHQLRAHMAFIGHPILGDDKYGDRALNHGPLRLWCRSISIHADAPLADYRGRRFEAPEPEWWEEKPV